MHIVGGINLPKSADVSDLYIQCNEAASINYQEDDKKVVLRQGGIISSNSYFNSFYEQNVSFSLDSCVASTGFCKDFKLENLLLSSQ